MSVEFPQYHATAAHYWTNRETTRGSQITEGRAEGRSDSCLYLTRSCCPQAFFDWPDPAERRCYRIKKVSGTEGPYYRS